MSFGMMCICVAYSHGFITLHVAGALFFTASVVTCFLGALPSLDLRAV